MLLFIVSVIIAVFAAFFQLSEITIIGDGINLNLILPVVAALGVLHKDWTKRWILILISVFILKFSPVIGWFDVFLTFTLFLSVIIIDYLPWKTPINMSIAVAVGTAILSVEYFSFGSFILEVLLNVSAALIILLVLKLTYAEKIKNKENKFRRGSFR